MSYSSEVLADSPGSYLRLGESSGTNADDSQGFNQDGTYVNSPTLGVTGALVGDSDTAVTFAAGSSQRVLWTTLTSLGSSLLTASFEFWIKTTTTSVQSAFGVVNTGTSMIAACNLNSTGDSASESGSLGFHMRGNGANATLGRVQSAGVNDGNWHHVVIVVQSSTTFDVYIDGLQKTVTYTTQAAITTPINFDFAMTLAARNVRGTPDRHLSGSLDEVAIYAARLSASRIRAHYWAGVLKGNTSTGTGTDTGEIGIAQALAATSTGTSTTTGAASVSWAVEGSSAGTGTTTGAVGLSLPLDTSSTGTSSTTGDLLVFKTLEGSSAGTSSTTGDTTVLWALEGSSTGTGTTAGDPVVSWALDGVSGGTGFTNGDLFVLVQTSPQVALGERRSAVLEWPDAREALIEPPVRDLTVAVPGDRTALIVGSTPELGTTLQQPSRTAEFEMALTSASIQDEEA